jgi:MCM P-loop domain
VQPKENGAKKDAKGGVAIRLPYLRVVDVQDDSESDSFTATFTCARNASHAQLRLALTHTHAAHCALSSMCSCCMPALLTSYDHGGPCHPCSFLSATRQPSPRCICCSEEEVAEFQEFARSPQLYDNIQTRIAPGIFGHENIKKAVACLLFGGTRKVCSPECSKATTGAESHDCSHIGGFSCAWWTFWTSLHKPIWSDAEDA